MFIESSFSRIHSFLGAGSRAYGQEALMSALTHPTLWNDTVEGRRYPPLTGSLVVDVAIIGAGITGLTTAWHLKAAGLRAAVIEARQVGAGTTGASTGNLYAALGPRMYSIAEKHGVAATCAVAQERSTAVDFIEKMVITYNIDCNFQRVPFYLFSAPDDEADEEVQQEFAALA